MLEVACGTGVNLGYYPPAVDSVLATDASEKMVAASRAKAAAQREEADTRRRETFVSVICPTTPERRGLHPLLYACFVAQTHERRELVIYDTGAEGTPSP